MFLVDHRRIRYRKTIVRRRIDVDSIWRVTLRARTPPAPSCARRNPRNRSFSLRGGLTGIPPKMQRFVTLGSFTATRANRPGNLVFDQRLAGKASRTVADSRGARLE